MSPLTDKAKKERKPRAKVAATAPAVMPVGVTADVTHVSKPARNYMGADSWTLDPLATLRLITASSIFGEPRFYEGRNESVAKIEAAIDAALSFDFKGTLDFAGDLRSRFNMRLNPQIIVVRAAVHPDRPAFTDRYPGYFETVQHAVAFRPDDITAQVEYYLAMFDDRKADTQGGDKNKKSRMPNVWRRAASKRLAAFSPYHITKYAGKGIGLIDVTRLLNTRYIRQRNELIDEMMKDENRPESREEEKTWLVLRSAGTRWLDILKSGITLTHSDLVFQLKNIMGDIPANDYKTAKVIAARLLSGVPGGKLFPYRYYIAYKQLERETFSHKELALDTLNKAIGVAIEAQPPLYGRVATLVDNSGSARSAKTFEGASAFMYEIGNLSGVMTALNADQGEVWVFGDNLAKVSVLKSESVLAQVSKINEIGNTIGHNTENGMWMFWREAIASKTHYDHVFIYSDMQAGQGGLYGVNPADYRQYAWSKDPRRIDLWKLVDEYRRTVHAQVNVFSVQIAGYDNSVQPENKYRGANLAGWTGKECSFAQNIIALWDQVDGQ